MVAMSNAATVTFNVVAPGATDVQVSVNGQQTKLEAKDADVPLFSGQMDAPDKANYKVNKVEQMQLINRSMLFLLEQMLISVFSNYHVRLN